MNTKIKLNKDNCALLPEFNDMNFNPNAFNIFLEASATPYKPSAPPYDPPIEYVPSAPPYEPSAPPYDPTIQYEPSAPPYEEPNTNETSSDLFSQSILTSVKSTREKLSISLQYVLKNSSMKDTVMGAYIPRLPNMPLSQLTPSSMTYKLVILVNDGYEYEDFAKILKVQSEKIIGQQFNKRVLSDVECVFHKYDQAGHEVLKNKIINSVLPNHLGNTISSTKNITPEDIDYFNKFSGKTSGPRLPPGTQLDIPTSGVNQNYIRGIIQEPAHCTVALVAVNNLQEITVSMVVLKSDRYYNTQSFEIIVNNPCYDPSLIRSPVAGSSGSVLIPLLRDASILYDTATSDILSLFNYNAVIGNPDLTNFSEDAVNKYMNKYYIRDTITPLSRTIRKSQDKIDTLKLEAINFKVSSTYYRYGFIPFGDFNGMILMKLEITDLIQEKMAKSNSSYLLIYFLERVVNKLKTSIQNNDVEGLKEELEDSIQFANELVIESQNSRTEIKTILNMPSHLTTSEAFVRHGGQRTRRRRRRRLTSKLFRKTKKHFKRRGRRVTRK